MFYSRTRSGLQLLSFGALHCGVVRPLNAQNLIPRSHSFMPCHRCILLLPLGSTFHRSFATAGRRPFAPEHTVVDAHSTSGNSRKLPASETMIHVTCRSLVIANHFITGKLPSTSARQLWIKNKASAVELNLTSS